MGIKDDPTKNEILEYVGRLFRKYFISITEHSCCGTRTNPINFIQFSSSSAPSTPFHSHQAKHIPSSLWVGEWKQKWNRTLQYPWTRAATLAAMARSICHLPTSSIRQVSFWTVQPRFWVRFAAMSQAQVMVSSLTYNRQRHHQHLLLIQERCPTFTPAALDIH